MKINNIDVKLIKRTTISNPEISIVIRCKNEEDKIKSCIQKIENQKINTKFEIIVIDSGSTDCTLSIIKDFDLSIYTIPSNQFQFGSSINLGIQLSKGKYCVFVSAHAIPANDNWLFSLIRPLQLDKKIAGSFSHQLYYSNTDFIQKRVIDDTFSSVDRIYTISSGSFKHNLHNVCFSNASSCIRKSVATSIKFSNVIASEDREWAYRVMINGYKIQYVSNSLIFHAHNESPKQWYKRIYINAEALYNFAGIKLNLLEFLPLFAVKVVNDIFYCQKKHIKITFSMVKKSIKYEYLYAMAHYKGSK